MKDSFTELAPAKINLFLKILNKRNDSYHNIRSGITLINLVDEIFIEKSSFFNINYIGKFAPKNNKYTDCIINKLFNTFKISKPKYNFTIKKNIPTGSGLGSASTNAAAVFRILNKINLYKLNKFEDAKILGSDIPLFLNDNDCLIRGVGEKITNKTFPKYYFLLVKPKLKLQTKKMYSLININKLNYKIELDNEEINEFDKGNDFEEIAKTQNKDIISIFKFLKNLNNLVFYSLTGSGSCCYAAFKKKQHAIDAQIKFKTKFPYLWSSMAENNINKLV
tara:strand:- start:638 stop:1474 length:837 start_codon:yes stop_codon:yes gene_type:complete